MHFTLANGMGNGISTTNVLKNIENTFILPKKEEEAKIFHSNSNRCISTFKLFAPQKNKKKKKTATESGDFSLRIVVLWCYFFSFFLLFFE